MSAIRRKSWKHLGAALLVVSGSAAAQSEALSQASQASVVAVSEVPAAAAMVLVAGGQFSVAALKPVGHSVHVVLVGAVEGARFTLKLAGETAKALGVAVGTVVVATATATGYLLCVGGEAIAFVPNEITAALVHEERLP